MDLNKKSFIAFSKECLIQEAESSVSIKNVVCHYNSWIKYSNIGAKKLRRSDIVELMTEIYGPPDVTSDTFLSLRIATDDDYDSMEMQKALKDLEIAEAHEKTVLEAAEHAKNAAKYLDQQVILATKNTEKARTKYRGLHTRILGKDP